MKPAANPASPARDEPPRPVIPDYELLRLVGRGSYGDVWLARGVTGVFRAIKVVWRERFTEPGPYEREFKGLKEFAAISLLETRQLALLHVGRNDVAGFFYYVMELADDAATGRETDPARYVPNTLREVRNRRGRLPAAECVALGTEIARGLAGLHARGLVHRDIKPSNIILVGGVPKLADIGLVASTTAAHTFVGTEGYVPPEGPGTPAADVFGLGKLLYELATGLDRHDYPRLPPALLALPDRKVLLELNEVLIRACEPVAARRHADAAALLDDLLLLQAGRSVRRLRNAERRLARSLRIATACALFAAIGAGGAWFEHRRAAGAEAERDALARKTVYSATLARVQRALETDDYGHARRLLAGLAPADGAPDLRGLEWHLLSGEARGDPAVVLRAGGPAMQRVFTAPDGSALAAQSADLTVTLWDARTLRELRRIPGVFTLAGYSADGRWLVGTDGEARLQRWSTATAAADTAPAPGTHRPLAPLGSDAALSFLDGTGQEPNAVVFWDFALHRETRRLSLPDDENGRRWDFYRSACSPDSRRFALALINGRMQSARWVVLVYDLATLQILHRFETGHRPSALGFSPDGRRLALALGDVAQVGVIDLAEGAWLWRRPVGGNQTNALAFSPDGAQLAVSGRSPLLRILDPVTGDSQYVFRGHTSIVAALAWDRTGTSLASADSAGEVRLWHLPATTRTVELSGLWQPAGGGRRLSLSPDGSRLAANDDPARGGLVTETTALAPVARIPGMTLPLGFSRDNRRLFLLRPHGDIETWNTAPTPGLLSRNTRLAGSTGSWTCGVLSREARFLAAGSDTGDLAFLDLRAGSPATVVRAHASNVVFVAIAADGSRLLSAESSIQRAILWDPAGMKELARLSALSVPLCGAFSPDERMLAIGWDDGVIDLRRADTGALLRRLHTDARRIQAVAFSGDSRRLACGGPDGTIYLLATDDGREIATLRINARPDFPSDYTVCDLAISSDDRTLAAYLGDGRIRLWRP